MFPRPLHRWKSFWLGLLVLAFLGWGWVRSMNHTDGFFWLPRHFILEAWQSTGQVGFAVNHELPGPTSISNFRWLHEAAPAGEPWFPRAVVPENYPSEFQCSIAHWLLILLFLIAWIGFLLWRVRRLKCLSAGSAQSPARRR